MPLYRTLGPFTYIDDGRVNHITRAGVIISISRETASELSGLVAHVDGGVTSFPRAEVVTYESYSDFPAQGNGGYIYVDRSGNAIYQWVDDEYVAIAGTTSWSALPGKPSEFPPSDHTHTASDIADAVRTVIVSTGSEARPSTTGTVLWLGGSSEPANYDDTKDIWFGTD
ncbi:hypothetical protein N857_gp049 [Mycobacterium phage Wanda]|uniref:Minor tail protein n=1 Tax=Mycobacterium phage Duke13 TaxID=2499038 RepID=A0A3S9UAR1_9CAUD|nr:hypothetical protein N857_gp049 [Mycobacterium phage Wanda]AGT11753.1 hypothetical protein PBI_WANDA_49 [Mycobacterium phage Wanda]AZS07387.1 hypothetical protein PBI_DUKE13_46 [Mycobacterium phage Duke13]